MNMVHLTKSQIKMFNLTKPYTFNMTNLIKPWPFWWTFVHLDQIFHLTFSQKVTLVKCNMCFQCSKPLVKMDIPFGQCGHFYQVGLIKTLCFLIMLFHKIVKPSPFSYVATIASLGFTSYFWITTIKCGGNHGHSFTIGIEDHSHFLFKCTSSTRVQDLSSPV
jgi:hypothetical protein